MIIRPSYESVGLTKSTYDEITNKEIRREQARNRIAVGGTILAGLFIAIYAFLQPSSATLSVRMLPVVAFVLIGWVFVMFPLMALAKGLIRNPKEYGKVESYRQAIHKYENDWAEAYFKSFWDALGRLSYHFEPDTGFPKTRLGFREWWPLPRTRFFTIFNGKRHIFVERTESSPLDRHAASKAVDALNFYHADVAGLISPSGFSKEALSYLAEDYKGRFFCQLGQEATEMIELINRLNTFGPAMPLDIYTETENLLSHLQKWRIKTYTPPT